MKPVTKEYTVNDLNIPTHQGVQHPNKIFILSGERKLKNFDITFHYVIIIAADSKETAQEYLEETKGTNLVEPVWLMGASYQTIWTQDGSKPEPVQAKILFSDFRAYNKPDSSSNQLINNGVSSNRRDCPG